jgi:hypothetical protein
VASRVTGPDGRAWFSHAGWQYERHFLVASRGDDLAVDLAGLSPDIATARKVSDAYKPVYDKFYGERFGIFIGLWVPSFFILSNRLSRKADELEDEVASEE